MSMVLKSWSTCTKDAVPKQRVKKPRTNTIKTPSDSLLTMLLTLLKTTPKAIPKSIAPAIIFNGSKNALSTLKALCIIKVFATTTARL